MWKELRQWAKELVQGEMKGGAGEFIVKADNVWFAKSVILAILDFEEVRHEYMFNKFKEKPIAIDCERAIAKKEDAESRIVYYLEATDDGNLPPDRKRVRVVEIAAHKKTREGDGEKQEEGGRK